MRGQRMVTDLFDLGYGDVQEREVVFDAFGTWELDTLSVHGRSVGHLAHMLSGNPNRLLGVEGAGSFFVNAEHTLRVMNTPDFPPAVKPYLPSTWEMRLKCSEGVMMYSGLTSVRLQIFCQTTRARATMLKVAKSC